jgi:sugar phosphate isomerase/epimerase
MHPRLTVHGSVFRGPTGLDEELASLARAGATRVGLFPDKLTAGGVEEGVSAVGAAGLEVTHLVQAGLVPIDRPEAWAAGVERLVWLLDLAERVGARFVYGPTGGAPALEWEDAADAFVAAIAPAAEASAVRGIPILVEPTISLIAEISILFTLADTVELCERTGLGVCLDVQHCWHERGLREAIRRSAPLLHLVQLSDWTSGNRCHVRSVPGDGVIPLERIVGWVLEEGYDGLFDLELYPEPGVPEHETVARGIERATALLERLGA